MKIGKTAENGVLRRSGAAARWRDDGHGATRSDDHARRCHRVKARIFGHQLRMRITPGAKKRAKNSDKLFV